MEELGPGRGQDGTVDISGSDSEPLEDHHIHQAKSHPPEPETLTRVWSTC